MYVLCFSQLFQDVLRRWWRRWRIDEDVEDEVREVEEEMVGKEAGYGRG